MNRSSKGKDVAVMRDRELFKASKEWERLTAGDWPEHEHEQRFTALIKKCMFMPPPHKLRKGPRG